MAKYNFEVRTATHVMLSETEELAGTGEARNEAARRVGLLLSTHADQLWSDEERRMDVTNDVGLILFVIQVSAMRTSATSGSNWKTL